MIDGVGAQAHSCLQRDGHGGVDSGQLFHGDAERQEVGPLPSVFLRERQAEQTHGPHLLHDVQRELLEPVHLLGARCDDLLRELANRSAELPLLSRQIEVHCAKG